VYKFRTTCNLDPFSAHKISISLANPYTKILVDTIYVAVLVSLNLGCFNIIIIIIIFTTSPLLSFLHRLQRHYLVRVSLTLRYISHWP